ncbi:MAG: hypothetical protein JNL43_11775 [Flavobacteriales bacterium]|nr:hypothetical protein [Flavobacteriales bacterium]
MKHLAQAVFIAAALIVSCKVQESREAMTDICRYWDAQKCNAAYGVSSNSDGVSKRTIRITMEEVPLFDSINAVGSVTSVVALQFVSLVERAALDGFDEIAVKASLGGHSLDESYPIADVREADSLYRIVDTFFKLFEQHRMEELNSINDDEYLPDTMMNRIVGSLVSLDSLGGPVHNARVLGFQLGSVEGTDLQVVAYRTQVSFGPKDYANVSFQVNRSNGKLSYMGVFDF